MASFCRAHLPFSSGILCGRSFVVGSVGPICAPNVPLFQGDPQCFRRRTNNPTLAHILSRGTPLPSLEGGHIPFFEEHENGPLSAEDRENSLSEEGNRADNHFGGNRARTQIPFSSFARSARDYNFAAAGFCIGVLRGEAHIADLCGSEDLFAASGSRGDQIVAGFDFDIVGFDFGTVGSDVGVGLGFGSGFDFDTGGFGHGTFVDFFPAFASGALLDELVGVAYTRGVFVVEFFLVSALELRIFVLLQHFLSSFL